MPKSPGSPDYGSGTIPINEKAILSRLRDTSQIYSRINSKMKSRRAIIARVIAENMSDNDTGTNVIPPFDQSQMIIRSTLGEPAKAVQHYATRLSTNVPQFTVVPLTEKKKLTEGMNRLAGEQERLDAELWQEACAVAGGRGEHQRIAEAMVVGGAGYFLVLPRDLAYGLPDREYFTDLTDESVKEMMGKGELSPSKIKHPKNGKMVYAESGDVWAARRKKALKDQKVAGKGLFMVRALPRDMVLREKDAEGVKWAAVVETVSASTFGPGSAWAMAAAANDKDFDGNPASYSLMINEKGQVIGGISQGAPDGYPVKGTAQFTFITYVDREELVYLVAGPNQVQGGKEIWRGKHHCKVRGVSSCPIIEVPCIRGDIDLPEYEFMSPLDPLYAVIPNINQMLTMRSNIAVWNATPRFVVELNNGSTLRGNDGEPVAVQSAPTPGMNPEDIAAYPGNVKQLTINATDLDHAIEIMFNRLDLYMPPPVSTGVAGASAPAWQVHQLIGQAQEALRQPADNLAYGITEAILMMHSWLRQLDMDVYFWDAPSGRYNSREMRGLIEFKPEDLTDSVVVKLELDTPEDLIVVDQVWQTRLKDGLCTREEYFENGARSQDAYAATIASYGQMVADSLLFGQPLPGSSLLSLVAQRVMGRLKVELPEWSENAARAQSQDMLMEAQEAQALAAAGVSPEQAMAGGGQAMIPGAGMPPQEAPAPGGGPQPYTGGAPMPLGPGEVPIGQPGANSIANAVGIVRPGMGMADTLAAQLGRPEGG